MVTWVKQEKFIIIARIAVFFLRSVDEFIPQGQYWAGRTPPPNNHPPNMAAANFIVITNGEGARLIEQPLPQC